MTDVAVELDPTLCDALDRFAETTGVDRTAALVLALRDWVIGNGYLRYDDLDEDTPVFGQA